MLLADFLKSSPEDYRNLEMPVVNGVFLTERKTNSDKCCDTYCSLDCRCNSDCDYCVCVSACPMYGECYTR